MGKKTTSLYMAKMQQGNYSPVVLYFYGRNVDSVKRYCKEVHYPKLKYDHIEVTKIGEYAYATENPVVQFTEEETDKIERHFANERLKLLGIEGAKQLAQDGVTV